MKHPAIAEFRLVRAQRCYNLFTVHALSIPENVPRFHHFTYGPVLATAATCRPTFVGGEPRIVGQAQDVKVFWFFSSEKNRLFFF
jgi:hypothetical protein